MPEAVVNEKAVTAVQNSESIPAENTQSPLEISDLLVEDVSIDGMCGVY